MSRILLLLLSTMIFFSCSRAPLKKIENAMRPVRTLPSFVDSKSSESFFITLRKHIDVMSRSSQVSDPMVFGKVKIKKDDYIKSLTEILNHPQDWIEWIQNNFDVYEVYGKENWGEVLSTGYYEPHVYGSREKSLEYSRAIYASPDENEINFTREEIECENKLANKNLELAWLDPVDAFFIQIQGSAVIRFSDESSLHVGFSNQNGQKYQAIGKFLTDVIPLEEMSLQRIKAYLKTLSQNDQQRILNKNPSYVYFKKLESGALTYSGMEVSPGRTIATDYNFFPKGALAFLDIEEPEFESINDMQPRSWKNSPRFVFDQDTGGAIKGGGRVDLYFGDDENAYQKAGVMRRVGMLYYLIPHLPLKH